MNTKQYIRSTLLAFTVGTSSAAHCDDLASVWQFELTMGGKRPVSTFYFSYQSRDRGGISLAEPGRRSDLRTALYSTDLSKTTAYTRFSTLLSDTTAENLTLFTFGLVTAVATVAGLRNLFNCADTADFDCGANKKQK